jgi:RNA polymerase sigma factor (sigma-70 family)
MSLDEKIKHSKIDWDYVYQKYHRPIHFLCSKYLGYGHNYLDDIASEVFLIAMEKQDQYDSSKGAINTWISTIAINACLQQKEKDKKTLGLVMDVQEDHSERLDEEDRIVLYNQIKKKLDANTHSKKDLFLDMLDGMSYKDAAIKYKVDEVTCRVNILRFIKSFREELKVKQPTKGKINKKITRNKVKSTKKKIEKNIYSNGISFTVYGYKDNDWKYLKTVRTLEEARKIKKENETT